LKVVHSLQDVDFSYNEKASKISECNTFKAFRVTYFRQLLMTGFCSFNNKMHSCKKQTTQYTVKQWFLAVRHTTYQQVAKYCVFVSLQCVCITDTNIALPQSIWHDFLLSLSLVYIELFCRINWILNRVSRYFRGNK